MSTVVVVEGELERMIERAVERALAKHEPTPSPRGWVGVPGAAEYLGISKEAIRSKVARNELPVHRQGRSVRFSIAELDAWARGES